MENSVNNLKARFSVAIGVLVLIGALVAIQPADAQPPVEWLHDSPLLIDVVAGTTTTATVDFRAHQDLLAPGATLEDLPEFFAMEPPVLSDIDKNEVGAITLLATVPANVARHTLLRGRVKLRENASTSAYPNFLDIEARVVWPTVGQAVGFSVSYSPEYTAVEVSGAGQRKILFYDEVPSQSGDNAVFYVHVNSLNGKPTVHDALLASAVNEADIQEVLVGDREFTRFTRSLGDEDPLVGFSTPYSSDEAITVTLLDPSLETNAAFRSLLESLDF